MREIFHGGLTGLGAELASAARIAATQMQHAMAAVLNADLELAELVLTDNEDLDQLGRRIEAHAGELLAPHVLAVADVPTVVCAVRAGERVERMGELARHVAELARRHHPHHTVPGPLAARFAKMSVLALESCLLLEDAIVAPNVMHWRRAREHADHRLARFHHEVLHTLRTARPPYPVHIAVDGALLAGYLERFGDQAMKVTAQLDQVATGATPSPPAR